MKDSLLICLHLLGVLTKEETVRQSPHNRLMWKTHNLDFLFHFQMHRHLSLIERRESLENLEYSK